MSDIACVFTSRFPYITWAGDPAKFKTDLEVKQILLFSPKTTGEFSCPFVLDILIQHPFLTLCVGDIEC